MTSDEAKIRRKVFLKYVEEIFEEMGKSVLGKAIDRERIDYIFGQLDRREKLELFKKPHVTDFLKEHGFQYKPAGYHGNAVSQKWINKNIALGKNGKKINRSFNPKLY